MGVMPRLTLSLTDEEIKKLKNLSKKEKRPYSRQVAYMLDFYIADKEEKEKQ